MCMIITLCSTEQYDAAHSTAFYYVISWPLYFPEFVEPHLCFRLSLQVASTLPSH